MTDEEALLRAKHFRSLRIWMGAVLSLACAIYFCIETISRSAATWQHHYYVIAASAVWYALTSFFVGWLAFGDDRLVIRFAYLTAAVLAMLLFAIASFDYRFRVEMLVFVPCFLILQYILLFCCKSFMPGIHSSVNRERFSTQITIAEMLFITGCVGCVLGILREHWLTVDFTIVRLSWMQNRWAWIVIKIIIPVAMSVLIWALTFRYAATIASLLLLVISAATSFGLSASCVHLRWDTEEFLEFISILNLLGFALLQILRAHGYRFVWRWSKPAASEANQ